MESRCHCYYPRRRDEDTTPAHTAHTCRNAMRVRSTCRTGHTAHLATPVHNLPQRVEIEHGSAGSHGSERTHTSTQKNENGAILSEVPYRDHRVRTAPPPHPDSRRHPLRVRSCVLPLETPKHYWAATWENAVVKQCL